MPIVPSAAGQILDDVYFILQSAPPTIQGVQVGLVGLVGLFQQGIAGAIYSISDYGTAVRLLGPSSANVGGPIAILNLLRQKCGNIQVVPCFGAEAAAASVTLYDSQTTPGTLGTLTAAQSNPQTNVMSQLLGNYPNTWSVSVTLPSTPNGTFNLAITAGSITETYLGLSPSTWSATVNGKSQVVLATLPTTPSSNVAAVGSFTLSGGTCGTLTVGTATDNALIGSVGSGGATTGLASLATLPQNELNFVLGAEYSSSTFNTALAAFASTQDCMAIMCAISGQTVSQTQSAVSGISQSNVAFVDGWATCYDADQGVNRTCAPTALVAGMASQLPPQNSWGNNNISGAQGLVVARSRADMATLQQSGVLCLTNQIPAGGFGTRSGVASNGSDLYVQRMQYFLAFSIVNSSGWAVDKLQSQSTSDPLRNLVTQTIGNFLNGLQTANPQVIDSYQVVCNTANNSAAGIAAGQMQVTVTVVLLAAAKQITITANISTSAQIVTNISTN
jgi:hypothetical protein